MNSFVGFIQNKYIYVPVLLWFFIQLYKEGLAKLVEMPVNWCEGLGLQGGSSGKW
mgnify:CR=1 FL=1